MLKTLAFILAVFALIASAGTPTASSHYRITIFEPAAVQGTVLQPGEYRLTLADTKLTIIGENGKNPLELKVKVETQEKKFDSTSVQLDTLGGKSAITEIRLGGTKTKLILN
jgi:hypothetical protein